MAAPCSRILVSRCFAPSIPYAPNRRVHLGRRALTCHPGAGRNLEASSISTTAAISIRLACSGYYMLTGALPFDGRTFEALAAKHVAEPHVPLADVCPDAPAPLGEAIERCLMKMREDRWRTGRDLADALNMTPSKRRWFGVKKTATSAVLRTRMLAELTILSAAMKAVFKWTTA